MIHRFRGLLAALAASALLLAGPAQSDLLSRSAYDSAIATNLPDNATGAISEQDVRDAYTDLADSVVWQGEVEHRVINMSTTTPPASPTAGDSYVVGAAATGAWSGQDGNIAVYDGDAAAWVFFAPVDGLPVWNQADDTLYRWDAAAGPAAWVAQATGSIATQDDGVAVNSATTLNFTGAGVVVTDAGGGVAGVAIAGGGAGNEDYGIFAVRDYGATPDSGVDEATDIQSAIAAAEAAGGGVVLFEEGDYNIASTLVIDSPGVWLQGLRSRSPANSASATGTRLIWTGASGAGNNLVKFETPSGGSNPINWGGGVRDLSLDGAGSGYIGLQISSWLGGRVERVEIRGVTQSGIQVQTLNAGALADNSDTQEWVFEQFYVRLTGSAVGLRLLGGTNANTSFNTWRNGWITHENGQGIFVFNADNNVFDHIRVFRASGTGYSLEIGGNIATTNVNDANSFRNSYFQGPMAIRGTGSGYTLGKAAGNKLIDLDASNGSSTPTSGGSLVEAGGSPILWRTSTQTTFTSTP